MSMDVEFWLTFLNFKVPRSTLELHIDPAHGSDPAVLDKALGA